MTDAKPRCPGVTPRSLLFGSLGALIIAVGTPYGDMMVKTALMSLDVFTPGAIFLFFLMVGGLNVVLKLIDRRHLLPVRLALDRAELCVAYVMLIVACAIPTMGLTESFLPILTGANYYTTPTNNWAELVQPHVRPWLVPQGEEAVRTFYEGLAPGASIPWGAWIRPLFCWSAFLLVFYFVSVCMMVILRKQWVERERLLYPMAQLPLLMTEEDDTHAVLPPFFRNRLMWFGFAIPFTLMSWNCLHNYFHFLPPIQLRWAVPMFRETMSLRLSVLFVIIGFSYLLSLDIAFSLWFFHLLGVVQSGLLNMVGFTIGPADPFGARSATVAHQSMGAMVVLVVFGLWMARGHLRDVFAKAFGRAPDVDDSDELLSYRVAVWGLILGVIGMFLWLRLTGIPALPLALFLFACFVILLALTRIVCEGGIAFLRSSLIPQAFVIRGFGSKCLGAAGLVGLAYTFVWLADIRTFVMVHCANGLKIADSARVRTRPLFWAVMLALVISLVSSIWIVLTLSYTHGGANLQRWFFVGAPQYPFRYAANFMSHPEAISPGRWLFTGIGSGAMAFLMFMRYNFLWWPLHPLGFTLACSLPLDATWFSVFIAWLLKSLVLKLGGVKVYRRFLPLFMGLIIGQACCGGFWLIVDFLTGMTANYVPFQ